MRHEGRRVPVVALDLTVWWSAPNSGVASRDVGDKAFLERG